MVGIRHRLQPFFYGISRQHRNKKMPRDLAASHGKTGRLIQACHQPRSFSGIDFVSMGVPRAISNALLQ